MAPFFSLAVFAMAAEMTLTFYTASGSGQTEHHMLIRAQDCTEGDVNLGAWTRSRLTHRAVGFGGCEFI